MRSVNEGDLFSYQKCLSSQLNLVLNLAKNPEFTTLVATEISKYFFQHLKLFEALKKPCSLTKSLPSHWPTIVSARLDSVVRYLAVSIGFKIGTWNGTDAFTPQDIESIMGTVKSVRFDSNLFSKNQEEMEKFYLKEISLREQQEPGGIQTAYASMTRNDVVNFFTSD
jgi:hypothetical protein